MTYNLIDFELLTFNFDLYYNGGGLGVLGGWPNQGTLAYPQDLKLFIGASFFLAVRARVYKGGNLKPFYKIF
jgi:hypothetical protein